MNCPRVALIVYGTQRDWGNSFIGNEVVRSYGIERRISQNTRTIEQRKRVSRERIRGKEKEKRKNAKNHIGYIWDARGIGCFHATAWDSWDAYASENSSEKTHTPVICVAN